MGRRKKIKRWGMPRDQREPLLARVSLLLLLLNLFIWVGLRSTDVLLVTLASTLVSLAGLIFGKMAVRRIRRAGGRLQGEPMAKIAYWGNLAVCIVSALMFAYAAAMGILRGELL